jgi:putative transposase
MLGFVERERSHHSVAMLCQELGVSISGYYAWRSRACSARVQAEAELTERIVTIHRARRGICGAPRIHAELADEGIHCGRKRVARLMRAADLVGCHRRRGVRTTRRAAGTAPAPDRVQRRFVATTSNQLWTADITYVPTWTGFLYLAVVLDFYGRRIVGWAMAEHLHTELALGALEMVLTNSRPAAGLIHHTDRGSQYTAQAYQAVLARHQIVPSLSRAGDCYDNVVAESFLTTLKTELRGRQSWPTRRAARQAISEWIEVVYNRQRRHSALGYRSPDAFEAQYTV